MYSGDEFYDDDMTSGPLDAARAAAPPVCGYRIFDGLHDCVLPAGHDGPHNAVPPSPVREAGLRERFEHWYLDADDPKNDTSFINGWNECLDTVRAALRAEPVPLDVEPCLYPGCGHDALHTARLTDPKGATDGE